MKITQIACNQEGESFFEDLQIDVQDQGLIGKLSQDFTVKSLVFRENPPGYEYSWHTAPRRQYIVLLAGAISIEVSQGEIRKFYSGDVFIVADTTGKGHKSKSIDGKARKSLFIAF